MGYLRQFLSKEAEEPTQQPTEQKKSGMNAVSALPGKLGEVGKGAFRVGKGAFRAAGEFADAGKNLLGGDSGQPISKRQVTEANRARRYNQLMREAHKAGEQELFESGETDPAAVKDIFERKARETVEKDIRSHADWWGSGAEERAGEIEAQRKAYEQASGQTKKMWTAPGTDVSRLTPQQQKQMSDIGRRSSWTGRVAGWLAPESWMAGQAGEGLAGQFESGFREETANLAEQTRQKVQAERQAAIGKYAPWALGGLGLLGGLALMSGMGGRSGGRRPRSPRQQKGWYQSTYGGNM